MRLSGVVSIELKIIAILKFKNQNVLFPLSPYNNTRFGYGTMPLNTGLPTTIFRRQICLSSNLEDQFFAVFKILLKSIDRKIG